MIKKWAMGLPKGCPNVHKCTTLGQRKDLRGIEGKKALKVQWDQGLTGLGVADASLFGSTEKGWQKIHKSHFNMVLW